MHSVVYADMSSLAYRYARCRKLDGPLVTLDGELNGSNEL
jgi:hypothetical protein